MKHHANSTGLISTAGFTLLELMISIALGMALLLTCFSVLRLTAQTLAASKRLAGENQLLRTAMHQALEEVDFWVLADNPSDTTKQALRGLDPTGAYKPFTPFANVPDPVNSSSGFVDSSTSNFNESASPMPIGWNPNPLAWAAWNPRTWCQSCVAEKVGNGGDVWGTYDIYDNLSTSLSPHYWYDDQVLGLMNALGYYGIYEYLPSSAYLTYHGTGNALPLGSNNGWSWGGQPNSLLGNGWWLCSDDGGDNNMKGRLRPSNGTHYFLPGQAAELLAETSSVPETPGCRWGPSNQTVCAPFGIQGLCRNMQAGNVGYNGRDSRLATTVKDSNGNYDWTNYFDVNIITFFLNMTNNGQDLLPQHPATWADVTYEVHRFMERGHPVNACLVTLRKPFGGGMVIPFTCIGTTLRGARMQRDPSSPSGWNLDPFNGACLDYATPP